MFLPYEQIADTSRVWMYQSNRLLTEAEQFTLETALVAFCDNWTAHKVNLRASFKIEASAIILLVVDEQNQGASGCSIDKSYEFLRSVESELNIELFNRKLITWMDDNQSVHISPLYEIPSLLAEGRFSPNSLMYDCTLQSLDLIRSSWLKEARHTWLGNRFDAHLISN